MPLQKSCIVLALSIACVALAPNGPWDMFNIAPASRDLWPTSVVAIHGPVTAPDHLVNEDHTNVTTLQGDSWVALDFGKEAGTVICASAQPSHLHQFLGWGGYYAHD